MSEPEFTSEELRALEELADLSERDPALYRQIVSEGFAEAESQEHGEALLGIVQNAAQHRQEQDRALLDAVSRATLEQAEGGQE